MRRKNHCNKTCKSNGMQHENYGDATLKIVHWNMKNCLVLRYPEWKPVISQYQSTAHELYARFYSYDIRVYIISARAIFTFYRADSVLSYTFPDRLSVRAVVSQTSHLLNWSSSYLSDWSSMTFICQNGHLSSWSSVNRLKHVLDIYPIDNISTLVTYKCGHLSEKSSVRVIICQAGHF